MFKAVFSRLSDEGKYLDARPQLGHSFLFTRIIESMCINRRVDAGVDSFKEII